MTPEQAAQLIKRARELTKDIYPGPWIDDVDGDDGGLRVFNPDHPYDAFYIWFGDMEETEGIDHHTAKFVSNARQLVPDLANALETALARIDELEKAALAFLAQQSQDLGLYDYYPEEEDEATEQPQPDQGQE